MTQPIVLRAKRLVASVVGRKASEDTLFLKVGEWVEVRSKEEILRTLDERGRLDGLPFMPQMFKYCGQRLKVFRRAHKTCDTINNSGGRKLEDAVHLEGIRCDGAAYAGCGASCTIFWKEAWLKRAGDPAREVARGTGACTERDVVAGTMAPESTPDDPRYACQATDLLKATEPLPWWDARQYVEDVTSGNATLSELVDGVGFVLSRSIVNRLGLRYGLGDEIMAVYDFIQKKRGRPPYPRKVGRVPAGQKTPLVQLGLRPGQFAQLRPYDEILDTLDSANKNRGMFFDAEEVPYCGGVYEVRSRVDKIIDERTGRPIPIKSGGAVILNGVFCRAHYSKNRMFCPRAVFPFFKETWLKKVDDAAPAESHDAPGDHGGPTNGYSVR